ncbi:uracil-DNA glycosylase [Peptococcus simiae]|uniref:uracil-DNA glycosylase n=1 Tax=Peptococcus simiae TaxID=1643805 RepID=UPI00397FFE2D
MKPFLHNDWQALLADEFDKPYYQKLRAFLKQAYQTERVFPPMNAIYTALHETPYHEVRVVILGQDPYHGAGQAHGLAFSVQEGVRVPPSLQNIFKELQADLGCPIPTDGYLLGWARQGVLLLNTTLTVADGRPKSHAGQGWEELTDAIIKVLAARERPMVFILWGAHAQSKIPLIGHQHHIIKSPHPSPLSAHRGFFGSRPFSRANAYLEGDGLRPIAWCMTHVEED